MLARHLVTHACSIMQSTAEMLAPKASEFHGSVSWEINFINLTVPLTMLAAVVFAPQVCPCLYVLTMPDGLVDAQTSVLTSVNSPATLCSRVKHGQA